MKAMVGLVLAILIIFGFKLFWPSSDFEINDVTQHEVINEEQDSQRDTPDVTDSELSLFELNAPDDAEKTKLMTAEYDTLKQSRKTLKRHLALLKNEMWGLKFSADMAKEMTTTLMGASKLLKNPPMLGAFSSVEQIKDEITKVEFAKKSLEQIDKIIKAKIKANTNSKDQANSAIQ